MRPAPVIAARSAFTFITLLFAAVARAGDILILTSSVDVVAELEQELDLVAAPGVDDLRVFTARIQNERFEAPFSIVVAQAPELSDATAGAATGLLSQYGARYLLLLGPGISMSTKLKPGDVALSRMVWDYALAGEGVTPLFARAFRSDAALINASLAASVASRAPGVMRSAKMAAGAVAGGAWDDGRAPALRESILGANGRTLAVVPGAASVGDAVERYASKHGRVGMLLIAGVSASPANARTAANTANAVRFTLRLIRQHWPSPPSR